MGAILGSCHENKNVLSRGRSMEHSQGKMKIYDALKIAVETLEEKKMMYREEYKLTAARVDDEWVFWFIFLPETPGLDITVFVSDDGQTRFLPGL
jgi:hypothetical protein